MTAANSRTGAARATPSDGGPAPLFKMRGAYLIDPASDTADIGSDLCSLADALVATIHAIDDAAQWASEELSELRLGALNQAKQVSGLAAEYIRRTVASRKPADVCEAVSGPAEWPQLCAALKSASISLYAAHGCVRSAIALLNHVDFNAEMASDVRGDDYDVLRPIREMLSQARDRTLTESDSIDALLARAALVQGAMQ